MEAEGTNSTPESYPMNSGDGPHSYTSNSTHQRRLIETAKDLIEEAVQDMLELDPSCINGSKPFSVADLGCSVGQNTLTAVQNITDAVEKLYKAKNYTNPSAMEFQIFFNDHSSNDFNSLFRSLPNDSSSHKFYAGVPGSFYDRLFPKSSLHFVNCSSALQWMSRVPIEVADRGSHAWSGKSIHYSTSGAEAACEAYGVQCERDIECFLSARAQEIANGGLALIVVPSRPTHCTVSQTAHAATFGLLESCLSEMVKLGHISEEKVESFNIPLYFPTSNEMELIINNNGNFSIERMGILNRRMRYIKPSVEFVVGMTRAIMEELFKKHFGHQVIEEIFERYAKKMGENLDELDSIIREHEDLFVILKRK